MHAGLVEADFIRHEDGTWEPRDLSRFQEAKAELIRQIGARSEAEYDELMRTEGPIFLTRLFTAR